MALDYNYPFSSPSEGNIENVIIQAFQDPDVTPSLDYCNRFSVKDPRWGATGDGITDDTNAIMAAVNYCWNNGNVRGSVEVPPGNYKISDTDSDGFGLKIPDGVHFIGHGYASRLFSTTAIKMVQIRMANAGVPMMLGAQSPYV